MNDTESGKLERMVPVFKFDWPNGISMVDIVQQYWDFLVCITLLLCSLVPDKLSVGVLVNSIILQYQRLQFQDRILRTNSNLKQTGATLLLM